jgi:hypothetical protein
LRYRLRLGAELCDVVGEERGLVAGAGDGDVSEAGVEQVRVNFGISVDENTFGGKPLGAVAGDGVAVVEMTMLVGVKFDLAVVVEADGQAPVGMDRLDRGHVAICNAERFVGRGELDADSGHQLPLFRTTETEIVDMMGCVTSSMRQFNQRSVQALIDQKFHRAPERPRARRVAQMGFCFAHGREAGRPRRGKA